MAELWKEFLEELRFCALKSPTAPMAVSIMTEHDGDCNAGTFQEHNNFGSRTPWDIKIAEWPLLTPPET